MLKASNCISNLRGLDRDEAIRKNVFTNNSVTLIPVEEADKEEIKKDLLLEKDNGI